MKTAVEYIEEQLKVSNKDAYNDLFEVISVAKELERKQMESSIEDGYVGCCNKKIKVVLKGNFWEKQENIFFITTEDTVDVFDGDKVFSVENKPFLINTIMCLTVSENIKELYPRRIFFSTLKIAETYVIFNKTCLSINEIAVIIGQCNMTTYIDLDILIEKLKGLIKVKMNLF